MILRKPVFVSKMALERDPEAAMETAYDLAAEWFRLRGVDNSAIQPPVRLPEENTVTGYLEFVYPAEVSVDE